MCLRQHFHLHNYCEIMKHYIVHHQLPKTISANNILSIIVRYNYYFNSPGALTRIRRNDLLSFKIISIALEPCLYISELIAKIQAKSIKSINLV